LVYEVFRNQLGSDLHEFPVAQAVMASSAYPAIFSPVTLRDFSSSDADERYSHLMDGGVRDHLALVPINAMLRRFAQGQSLAGLGLDEITLACDVSRGLPRPPETASTSAETGDAIVATTAERAVLPKKVMVIGIDAGNPSSGLPAAKADPRTSPLDSVLPARDVIASVDASLDDQRILRVTELLEIRRYLTGKKARMDLTEQCVNDEKRPSSISDCVSHSMNNSNFADGLDHDPHCCPVIGFGIHAYLKYPELSFGLLRRADIDWRQKWGAGMITLQCLADNDHGRGRDDSYYSKLRRMPIRLSVSSDELRTIREAAHALVQAMLTRFCDPATKRLGGVDSIPCEPPVPPAEYECRPAPGGNIR
jgi:hypothetical protein